MKNILVGIDFHDYSETLINKALELAKPFNSKIWLLHVAAPDPDFIGYEVGPQYIRDERAKTLNKEHSKLWDYTLFVRQQGIEAEGLLIQGGTLSTIIDESKKLNIDLIVSGYHDHNFLYNAFFGNTSLSLIKKTNIPILVIPLG